MPGSNLHELLTAGPKMVKEAEISYGLTENRHAALMKGSVQKWPHTFARDDNGTCSSCGQEQYHDLRDNRICWVTYKSNPSK